jgi:Tfp pilus assembly protein PilF
MRLFGGPRRPGSRAQLNAATRALQSGDLEGATARLREVLAQDPQNVAALLNLGVAYHQAGQHSKAIEQFAQVAVLRPNEARAYVNLAAAENALGHLERAEEALLKALEIAPQQAGVHHNLGVIYLKREQYGNAMAEFELELAVNPGARETEAALRSLREKLLPR